uniref:Ig-like domain-containing protein n=1 Tax=Monopterus albus TaxID=43700 RepID=A0A3Q3KH47_MONAL
MSIQAAAIQFTKEPKSQDALHGRSAMLRCEVSDPADITYSWLHNGQALENDERRFLEASNLKFTAVDRQLDAGNFECVAQNKVTGEALHSTNASFNIKFCIYSNHGCSLSPSLSLSLPHSQTLFSEINEAKLQFLQF